MSNQVVSDFERLLNSIKKDGCDEGVMISLEDGLKKNPDLVKKVIHEYDNCHTDNLREVYASLIVEVKPIDPYKSYLIEHHDWEESDFE